MKNRHCVWMTLLLIGTFLLIGWTSLYAAEATVKLRYSSIMSPMHPQSQLQADWGKEVEKRTDGRVTVSYFPGNTLTSPPQAYDAVVQGIVDVGHSLPSYSAGRFPLSEVMSLPLGFISGYQATKVVNDFYQKFEPKEFNGTKIMYFLTTGPTAFHGNFMINSVTDLQNKRFKANAENMPIIKSFDAVPVAMPMPEVYDAMKKGLLDGILTTTEILKYWKIADVCKSVYKIEATNSVANQFVAMNLDKWNSISKTDQKIIEQINQEWIEKAAVLWNVLPTESEAYGEKAGIKITKATLKEEALSAAKMEPIINKYVADMEAKGLPGAEALKFVQQDMLKYKK